MQGPNKISGSINFGPNFFWVKQFPSAKNLDKYHQDKVVRVNVTWTTVPNTLDYLILVSSYCIQNLSFIGYVEGQKKMGTGWVGGWFHGGK